MTKFTTIKPKPFIAWDGEGNNKGIISGQQPQKYMLIGFINEDDSIRELLIDDNLTYKEIIPWICETAKPYAKTHNHVSFSFKYDMTMILRDMPENVIIDILKTKTGGYVTIDNTVYHLKCILGKFLTIRKEDNRNSPAITIYDVFSFFQKSLIASCKEYGIDTSLFSDGKANRNSFSIDNIQEIKQYWINENIALCKLMKTLDTYFREIGLELKAWHGPGAAANVELGKHQINKYQINTYKEREIQKALQQAYFGGRFELFKFGFTTKTVYSADLNSAYPTAIRLVPDMTEHQWLTYKDERKNIYHPFSIYHIKWHFDYNDKHLVGPFPHRNVYNRVTFPMKGENYIWSPEMELFIDHPSVEIIERFSYGEDKCKYSYPMRSVIDSRYKQRQQLKAEKNPAQLAVKLVLNSFYGKFAQTVGYEQGNPRSKPRYHDFAWAGYITSYCRGEMYKIIKQTGFDNVIAVQTDGIYTYADLPAYGYTSSKELGEWELDSYESASYMGSGIGALKHNGEWEIKTRGINKQNLSVETLIEWGQEKFYIKNYIPRYPERYTTERRFIGITQALSRGKQFIASTWVELEKRLTLSQEKRRHKQDHCKRCFTNDETIMHDTCIIVSGEEFDGKNSLNSEKGLLSYPKDVPWGYQDGRIRLLKENRRKAALKALNRDEDLLEDDDTMMFFELLTNEMGMF